MPLLRGLAAAMSEITTPPALAGLGELIAYLPYHWGFGLDASVVVVAGGETGLGPISRADVPATRDQDAALAQRMAVQLAGCRPSALDVVVHAEPARARALCLPLLRRLTEEVAPVRHVAVAQPARRRWQLLSCACPRRCPTGCWEPLPDPEAVSSLRAAGALPSPLPDRAHLRRALEPVGEVAGAVAAVRPRPWSTAGYAAALARVLDLRPEAPAVAQLEPAVIAEVLHGWCRTRVRDHVLQWLMPGEPPDDQELTAALGRAFVDGQLVDVRELLVPAHLATGRGALTRRLSQLVGCAPAPLVAPAASVLAHWCWRTGGGAMATIAVERALEADPAYRLAQLLRLVMAVGLRPPP